MIIAAVLIILLNRARTGFRQSETRINRIIVFTVNTGAVTSIFAIITAISVSNVIINLYTSGTDLKNNIRYHSGRITLSSFACSSSPADVSLYDQYIVLSTLASNRRCSIL